MDELSEPAARPTIATLLVPEGAEMQGRIAAEAPQHLLIRGTFCGRMVLPGASRVIVAASATLNAEAVDVDEICVEGTLSGHVVANHVKLGPTAKVEGSLRYRSTFTALRGAQVRASLDGPIGAGP